MNFSRIKALIIKELIAVWQDKKSRFILIFPPLIQLFIFTFAATLDVKNVTIGVLNRDSGKHSAELIERIQGSPTFTRLITMENEKELSEAIDKQKVLIAIHFDQQFSRNVTESRDAAVQMIIDGRKSNSGQIAQGYVASIINRYNRDLGVFPEVEVVYRNWFNPNLIYPWFTLSGLVGVLTMLTSLSVTALSVARERELNTFDQLLITPLLPLEILIGKSIPAMMIGMTEGTLLLFAGVLLIDLPIVGSLTFLYIGMLVFVLATVGIGMFISSLSRTQQQATLGIFLFMVPSVILSGYATRIANMPEWLQKISIVNPLKYFIVIIRGITMKNTDIHVIIHNLLPMALIALFTLTTSAYLFRLGLRK